MLSAAAYASEPSSHTELESLLQKGLRDKYLGLVTPQGKQWQESDIYFVTVSYRVWQVGEAWSGRTFYKKVM